MYIIQQLLSQSDDRLMEIRVDTLRSNLTEICNYYLKDNGLVDILVETVIYAHQVEKHTHGISRLPKYFRKIDAGLMNPSAKVSFIKDNPIISVINANNGFGQFYTHKACELAIKKADKYGIGVIGVSNSNNFGIAGFFAKNIALSGKIGIVITNSAPAIAPYGGKKSLFGTSPIAFGFPTKDGGNPIVFDMACSQVARGKIRRNLKLEKEIPLGWAYDENGHPTIDPAEAIKGSLVAIGGYKGYGLSMSFDILAGILTGSGFAGKTKPLNHPTEISRYGHLVICMNIEHFISLSEYYESIEYMIGEILKEDGCKVPGENSNMLYNQHLDFIDLPMDLVIEVENMLKWVRQE